MLYNLQMVKDNLRNREGKRVFFLPAGDVLNSEARDFLFRERIPVLSDKEARIETYRVAGGGYLKTKPEHMTHLHGDVLVRKSHPRIAFRGAVDSLEAELLLCQLEAPQFQEELGQILSLARKLIRWDVLDEPVEKESLCSLTDQEIRLHSHMPQKYYGQPHFMPSVSDGRAILQLNRARCVARRAELQAVEAFSDRDGVPTRPDILQVLNRMSSMLYILMIREKAKG